MPQLEIYTNPDAEIFVLNSELRRIARSVGGFSQNLAAGLYKIKVNRAGALHEQLVELAEGQPQTLPLFIHNFSAVAPIGPMLADSVAVEGVAREALGMTPSPAILVLAHSPADVTHARTPFRGARLFPWRAAGRAVKLDQRRWASREVKGEMWTAVAVEADPEDGPFILELRHGSSVSRQAVLVVEDWETRVFLRAGKSEEPRLGSGATPFEVSIQMARRGSNVVYDDHWQTVEVARVALEKGLAIFTGRQLVEQLFYAKFDNPVAGMTGLHLFLDALERSAEGDASYEVTSATQGLAADPQSVVDEVLLNLTRLLHPRRAADADRRLGASAAEDLLYPDPNWPEASDLTALRLRANRVKTQVLVPAPPMFRASWDVLTTHAARSGLAWISRGFWRSTGDAGSLGAYVAWAPGRHSADRTLRMVAAQYERTAPIPDFRRKLDLGMTTLSRGQKGGAEPSRNRVLAQAFNLPRSFYERAPRKS